MENQKKRLGKENIANEGKNDTDERKKRQLEKNR